MNGQNESTGNMFKIYPNQCLGAEALGISKSSRAALLLLAAALPGARAAAVRAARAAGARRFAMAARSEHAQSSGV